MNIFSSTILIAIISIKTINSLPEKSSNSQSNRRLISLKTPIWFSEGDSDRKSVNYTRVHSRALHDAIKFYENPENMAELDFKQDDNKNWYFRGHIGGHSKLEKKPDELHELWHQIFNHSMITKRNATKSKNNIYKRAASKISVKGQPTRRPEYTLPPYDGPDPIYMRILLYVNYMDHYFSSDTEFRFYKLLVYLVSFWNGVEMKFSEFEYPKIKFHIAGIVIGNNKWSAPWLLANELLSKSKNPQSGEAFNNFRVFVLNNDPLPDDHWDIFVSQSNIEFNVNFNDPKPNIVGMALNGVTCNINPNASDSLKAVLFTDDLLFHGIDNIAHEIGHALGAIHDGEGALCDDYQFIMTPTVHAKTSPVETWSWCSKFRILQHLRNHSQDCWKHTPIVEKIDEVPEILPGHLVDPGAQCGMRGFNRVCEGNRNKIECDQLYCDSSNFFGIDPKYVPSLLVDKFGDCEDSGSALDGTICGNNRHCKNKKCVQWN